MCFIVYIAIGLGIVLFTGQLQEPLDDVPEPINTFMVIWIAFGCAIVWPHILYEHLSNE